jgi:hypothetical protein
MTDDPDERKLEIEADKTDPVRQLAALRNAVDEVEIHLRYGIRRLMLIGWLVVVLLCLILWQVWRSV